MCDYFIRSVERGEQARGIAVAGAGELGPVKLALFYSTPYQLTQPTPLLLRFFAAGYIWLFEQIF